MKNGIRISAIEVIKIIIFSIVLFIFTLLFATIGVLYMSIKGIDDIFIIACSAALGATIAFIIWVEILIRRSKSERKRKLKFFIKH